MNENSNSETSKKKQSTIDRLTKKREELEKELKATQHLIRSKKAAQTAKKAARDRKDRTKTLILLGLLFSKLLRDMRKEEQEGFRTAAELYHQNDLKTLESITGKKRTPEQIADLKAKRKASLEHDHAILTAAIESASAGTFK